MSQFNFTSEVIEKSKKIPVVVDFWADWCQPCKFLAPIIEELAAKSNGKWNLVKVNTDENQELMTKYEIRGIPAVKMFIDGEVAADFTGLLPKQKIIDWLDEHLPNERKEELKKIEKALTVENERDNALDALQKFVSDNKEMDSAALLLASHTVIDKPDEAKELVSHILWDHKEFELAEDIRSLAALMVCKANGQPNIEKQIKSVQTALKQKDQGLALTHLIDAVTIDKNYCEDLPRKAAIALFHLLGNDHDLTKKYRKKFEMALY